MPRVPGLGVPREVRSLGDMYHRLYYHLIWTTRERAPLVDARVAQFLCRFLRVIARQERARILEIGLVRTHAHLLVAAPPRMDWPRLVQRFKGASAHVANRDGIAPPEVRLRWARGYSIHTVSPRAVAVAREYLRRQPLHHPAEAIPDWAGDHLSEQESRTPDAARP